VIAFYDDISRQVRRAVEGLIEIAAPTAGQILVVGCSTSEVQGKKIGSAGSTEVARAVFEPLYDAARRAGLYLAIQCCEHLNRSIVTSSEVAEEYRLTPVTVLPAPEAGGAMAAHAMDALTRSVVVETVQGHLGVDIGDTFIGMHLRPVVVPVRLDIRYIGEAHLTMARTRPRLVGGSRALYPPDPHGKGPGSR